MGHEAWGVVYGVVCRVVMLHLRSRIASLWAAGPMREEVKSNEEIISDNFYSWGIKMFFSMYHFYVLIISFLFLRKRNKDHLHSLMCWTESYCHDAFWEWNHLYPFPMFSSVFRFKKWRSQCQSHRINPDESVVPHGKSTDGVHIIISIVVLTIGALHLYLRVDKSSEQHQCRGVIVHTAAWRES